MSQFPQSTKLPTAITHYSEQNLSCDHVTSANFMEMGVAGYLELVPNQKVSVSQRTFARPEPFVLPTYGASRINNRAFFVPYRTIMPSWNDFITDAVHTYGNGTIQIPQQTPQISNRQLVLALISHDDGDSPYVHTPGSTDPDTFDDCDFVLIVDGEAEAYNFTSRGKIIYKLLRQLGYGIDFNTDNEDIEHCALPLFALLKVYIDYYYPSQYSQNELIHDVTSIISYGGDEADIKTMLDFTTLRRLFRVIEEVCYDSDYFTSAWDNPNCPNTGAFSNVAVPDINLTPGDDTFYRNEARIIEDDPTGPRLQTRSGIVTGLTQYALTALRSLTDYMKRHQIVGARALDRYLSRFGITLPAEKLNRSVFIKSANQMIEVGDVTSTSSTPQMTLGGYAGKGISDGFLKFDFETNEFGLLLLISTIVPKTQYYQGADRITMHKSRLDYYTPEFDNLGTQALATREVYVPMNATKQYANGVIDAEKTFNYNNLIFGFTSRYAEYKRGRDMISGDYVLGSLNTGKEAWTFFRNLDPSFSEEGLETMHSLDFIQGKDRDQYLRVFNTHNPEIDYFNIIHKFDIKSHFPGKKMFDTYEFYEEDKAQKVTVDIGGVKAN